MAGAGDLAAAHDAFVSYARADSAFVGPFVSALRERGLDVWLDTSAIPGGARWRDEIAAGIDESDAVVVVLSPSSLMSPECKAELGYAVDAGKRLVPVVLEGVVPDAVPPSMRELQWTTGADPVRCAESVAEALAHEASSAHLHTALGLRVQRWQAAGRPPSYLLRGDELAEASSWLERSAATGRRPAPTAAMRELVHESRLAAETRAEALAAAARAVRVLDEATPAATAEKPCPCCRSAIPGHSAFCPRCATEIDAETGMGRARVAILLTDVEGSTRHWQESAALMPEALRGHHRLVAATVAEHGGLLPPDQGEGDSRLAIFGGPRGPSSAVLCAIALQERLASAQLGVPLRVRMALDVGDVVLSDGNAFGVTVNRCARIRGLASGGQILASDVAALHAPDPSALTDLGEAVLRDVVDPVHLFHIGVPGQVPRLPEVTRAAGEMRLPDLDADIVGREHDVDVVAAALDRHRFVTLTGAGGAGKTTLAVAAARTISPRFPGGVWFVDLVGVARGDDVGSAVAATLGLDRQSDEPWSEVANALSASAALLVLDNCEHLDDLRTVLVDQAGEVLGLVRVLATSRVPVGVPGEHLVPVGPLDLPDAGAVDLEAVRRSSSGELLLRVAADAGARLADADAADLAAVLRRVDGMPLAIGLAGARLRFQGAAALRTSLETSVDDLADVSGRLPERQRVLGSVVAWSIEHLGPAERDLLEVLASFDGAPDLAALAAVSATPDSLLLVPLSHVLDLSLAVAVELLDRRPRFRLLVPVREAVLAATDRERLRELALRRDDWLLEWARHGSRTLHNTEHDRDWVDEVASTQSDALASLSSWTARDPETAVELGVHLAPLWYELAVRPARTSLAPLVPAAAPTSTYSVLADVIVLHERSLDDRTAELVAGLRARASQVGDPWAAGAALQMSLEITQLFGPVADDDVAELARLVAETTAREASGEDPPAGVARASQIASHLLHLRSMARTYRDPRWAARQYLTERAQLSGPRHPSFVSLTWAALRNLVETEAIDEAEAEKRLLEICNASPDHLMGAMHALLEWRKGGVDEAERMLREDLALGPIPWEELYATSLLADLLIAKGDPAAALDLVSGAPLDQPGLAALFAPTREARALIALDLPERARERLSTIADRVDPTEADPGARTFLLCQALLAETPEEREAWLRRYDDLLAAYPNVVPWPRELADRAAL